MFYLYLTVRRIPLTSVHNRHGNQRENSHREDAKPRFCKARSVPFATKEAIEAELDCLESCGILEKVDYSLWAAPIVAVTKEKDGKIRICGDYKVTVNQSLEVDQYPLHKPAELFASLAGGQKFTKLDLSQAYQ